MRMSTGDGGRLCIFAQVSRARACGGCRRRPARPAPCRLARPAVKTRPRRRPRPPPSRRAGPPTISTPFCSSRAASRGIARPSSASAFARPFRDKPRYTMSLSPTFRPIRGGPQSRLAPHSVWQAARPCPSPLSRDHARVSLPTSLPTGDDVLDHHRGAAQPVMRAQRLGSARGCGTRDVAPAGWSATPPTVPCRATAAPTPACWTWSAWSGARTATRTTTRRRWADAPPSRRRRMPRRGTTGRCHARTVVATRTPSWGARTSRTRARASTPCSRRSAPSSARPGRTPRTSSVPTGRTRAAARSCWTACRSPLTG